MAVYDKDIRYPLLKKISKFEPFISDPTTVIVPEMNICAGAARIDIAVINHRIHGFEIKSERDTLERLPSQIKYYNRYFDSLTLVVSENHLEKAKEIIPDWWGIESVVESDLLIFNSELSPKQNESMNMLSLARDLWKNEQLELLGLYGITKGIKSKTRYELAEKIVDNIPAENIKEFLKNKLKNRDSWRAVPIQQLCDD